MQLKYSHTYVVTSNGQMEARLVEPALVEDRFAFNLCRRRRNLNKKSNINHRRMLTGTSHY